MASICSTRGLSGEHGLRIREGVGQQPSGLSAALRNARVSAAGRNSSGVSCSVDEVGRNEIHDQPEHDQRQKDHDDWARSHRPILAIASRETVSGDAEEALAPPRSFRLRIPAIDTCGAHPPSFGVDHDRRLVDRVAILRRSAESDDPRVNVLVECGDDVSS